MAWVEHFNLCWPCSFKREREGEFALTEETCIPNPTCINLTTTVAIVKFLFMILRMEIKCFLIMTKIMRVISFPLHLMETSFKT